MDFTIARDDLIAALKTAAAVADAKSTMPVLGHVALRVDGTTLTVAATDLNLFAVTRIAVDAKQAGALCLPAKMLHDLVSRLPSGPVRIRKVENDRAEVNSGKVTSRIVGIGDRDFPKVPDYGDNFRDAAAGPLAAMFRACQPSICRDETRFHLNGILVESDNGETRMVSTDGHRLAAVTRKMAVPCKTAGVIVPRRGVSEILRLLDGAETVGVTVHDRWIAVRRYSTTLGVKLADATFPPWRQVIPATHTTRVVVDREALAGAVRRGSLMASEVRGLKLHLRDGEIEIVSSDAARGEVREVIDCEGSGNLTIGVNGRYVSDLAAVLEDVDDGAIAIEFGGTLAPIVLRAATNPDAFVGVVMPMRV